ncbi:MAG TPA: hypothetical protein VEB21_13575, partial [Terriglobales bacterium]|nr:hypothetical protein [Terriglobales bacterium]
MTPLTSLAAGAQIVFAGDRSVTVPEEVAARFRPGDALYVTDHGGELLHVPAQQRQLAAAAVSRAFGAFQRMGEIEDEQISAFYAEFAARIESAGCWSEIAAANAADVEEAKRRGRSTTRLVADDKLRGAMVAGLRGWIGATSRRGQVLESLQHRGWQIELLGAELGVIGFVFEGRPNVLADATGVLRGGNTVVFRIGRDALGTARAIMTEAIVPALQTAALPEGAVSLVDSAEHAAGWALFSDNRLSLAVARGSGRAVATLGGLARQAGVPVSLHG